MVIRGNRRGNARQLSHYLLAQKDNEAIRILDIDGKQNPQAEELHRAVYLMGISAELSKSEKGLYHAQINPAIGEDAAMDDEQWLQAGDILGRQLGLTNQRRAIVLHTKKGRTHAHVVWERYDHAKERMVSDSFSRLAQDRARKEMETVFEQQPTPHRNKHRPELKASLSALWHQTGTGAQFVTAARRHHYIISEGSGRSPYMVVDENGRSYDLTRQLNGVKLKDVRQRLRHESLMGEKDAITYMRKSSNGGQEGGDSGTGKQKASFTQKIKTMKEEAKQTTGKAAANDNSKAQNTASEFKQNKADTTDRSHKQDKVKSQFAENKDDATKSEQQKSKEQRREAARQRLQPKPGPGFTRDIGLDID